VKERWRVGEGLVKEEKTGIEAEGAAFGGGRGLVFHYDTCYVKGARELVSEEMGG
jgi:hypothetical protein